MIDGPLLGVGRQILAGVFVTWALLDSLQGGALYIYSLRSDRFNELASDDSVASLLDYSAQTI